MSPPVSGSGTPGSSTGHSMTASLSQAEHGRRASGSIPRAESPPLVTANAHPNMEDYQRSFWERQMAKVEEQMMLPIHDVEEGTTTATGMDASASGDASALAAMIPPGTTAKDLMEIFKPQAGQLPLARIKKVMKASDDDVKMISAEAPILFARACEIFIADLTCRSYLHATSHRRRTVQRSDVVAAVAGSNVFDFLVDIVPRGGDGAAATSSNHGEAMQQGEEGQESFDAAAYPVQNGENGATE